MGGRRIVLMGAAAAVAVLAFLWQTGWLGRPGTQAPEPVVAAPAQPPASQPALPPLEPEAPAAPLAAADVAGALTELLGRTALVVTDDFPRRFVATVDNLGRAHAPPLMWPVTPTAGKFTVQEEGGSAVIAADNGARYTPFVLLAEGVDAAAAVQLYARMYPLLQAAYLELGFPGKSFHRRMVEVIDLLLATPRPPDPLPVQLVEVKGTVASQQPWVRYEYADPALESLSAGQKILLRVGPENQRRLKAKLAELRAELLRGAPRR
ncbi:MAG TPA: DUF3014 domain-containing protein [Ramlibacter sp.]|nr:DUF3014 domain-containing protein [Ramlibacter lithotrophicus]